MGSDMREDRLGAPADYGRSIARFNRLCYIAALLWIVGAMLISMRLSPIERGGVEYHDFSQFYMGGVIARHGAWDSLYPVPKPGSLNNPGEATDSDMRPKYAKLAEVRGVPAEKTRFIQPPPVALLLSPIGALDYRNAKRVWNLLMALSAWGVAMLAGIAFERATGGPSRTAGWIASGVAISPVTLETLRLMNITPFIALMIGLSIIGLRGGGGGGAMAVVIGAISKYATAAFVPLYAAARQWRALIVMGIVGLVVMAVTVGVTGMGPFRVYVHEMMPTFTRPHVFAWNRSIYALVMRLQHGVHDEKLQPLTGSLPLIVQSLRWATFLVIVAILFTRKQASWRQGRMFLAGAAALLSWFMVFSPILWDHYLFYLVPLWGWLIWEARGSLIKSIVVAGIILFQSTPGAFLDSHLATRLHLRGPLDVFPLMTVILIGLLGVVRLLAKPKETV